jgi:RHS repeat-associated protein
VVERTVSLPGGVLCTRRGSSTTDVWSYPNLHGDVVATTDGSGTKTGSSRGWDPFGNPVGSTTVPDNSTGLFDDGWHGAQQRPLEHETGLTPIIEMGARPYSPLLGRFVEVDPVEGGTPNNYVYPTDSVNSSDLSGECVQFWQKRCRGHKSIWMRGARHALRTGLSGGNPGELLSYYGAWTVSGCWGPACVTAGLSRAGGRERRGLGFSWSSRLRDVRFLGPSVNLLWNSTSGNPPSTGVGANVGGCAKDCYGVSKDAVTGGWSHSVGVGSPQVWRGVGEMEWWDLGGNPFGL